MIIYYLELFIIFYVVFCILYVNLFEIKGLLINL